MINTDAPLSAIAIFSEKCCIGMRRPICECFDSDIYLQYFLFSVNLALIDMEHLTTPSMRRGSVSLTVWRRLNIAKFDLLATGFFPQGRRIVRGSWRANLKPARFRIPPINQTYSHSFPLIHLFLSFFFPSTVANFLGLIRRSHFGELFIILFYKDALIYWTSIPSTLYKIYLQVHFYCTFVNLH